MLMRCAGKPERRRCPEPAGTCGGGHRVRARDRRTVRVGLLALNTPVLCLDEPKAPARPETEAFGPLITASGVGVLIEHDMPVVTNISTRVRCLEAGSVSAEGQPAETQSHPLGIATYLGTDEHADGQRAQQDTNWVGMSSAHVPWRRPLMDSTRPSLDWFPVAGRGEGAQFTGDIGPGWGVDDLAVTGVGET